MAFLDNSGDIILDAVLTDAGRRRLAEGEGKFRISKFALGDDEINYGSYDKNNASGSAYYDLSILQTPIFEAFTNNASSLKSKILTITDPNLLYLPVIKLNEMLGGNKRRQANFGVNTFLITADKTTRDAFTGTGAPDGVMFGDADSGGNVVGATIRLDQGLDTNSISIAVGLPADLREDTFVVEMDDRLGKLIGHAGSTAKAPSNIDDDSVATYIVSLGVDSAFVSEDDNTTDPGGSGDQTLAGPRGNTLEFKIRSKQELADSDYYFGLFGSTATNANIGSDFPAINTVKFIDTTVTIYGASTGYTVQVPIRYFKKTA
jgi:hypothetical protein